MVVLLGCTTQVMSRQFVTADICRPTMFMSDTPLVTSLSITMPVFTQLWGFELVRQAKQVLKHDLTIIIP